MKKQVFRELYYGNEEITLEKNNNAKEVKIKAVKPKKTAKIKEKIKNLFKKRGK